MSKTILINFTNFDKFVQFIKIWAEAVFEKIEGNFKKNSTYGFIYILWHSYARPGTHTDFFFVSRAGSQNPFQERSTGFRLYILDKNPKILPWRSKNGTSSILTMDSDTTTSKTIPISVSAESKFSKIR